MRKHEQIFAFEGPTLKAEYDGWYLHAKMFAPSDELLTIDELADRLKVKKSFVYEHTRRRAAVRNVRPLPHIRMGKYLRFNWTEVLNWLTELEQKGAVAA
jgi:excisionase family DNA binding protein